MDLIKWLLSGDVAIQYQTKRDLMEHDDSELRQKMLRKGFVKRILELQQPNYHWGGGYYRKKWISTHYSIMELRRLNAPKTEQITNSLEAILRNHTTDDGGIATNPRIWKISDVCLNGMLLHAFCYFEIDQDKLISIMNYILSQQLPDGGYNCNWNQPKYKTKHSSLHSTLSVVEGMNSYINYGYTYRLEEVRKQRQEAIEFILMHRLYKSDKTGEVIRKSFTMLSFPPRWFFDILRCLDAFQDGKIPYDERMEDAFDILRKKRRKDGTWPLQQKYPGVVHFDMEKPGSPSRMNTLRVLRVYKWFKPEEYKQILGEVK